MFKKLNEFLTKLFIKCLDSFSDKLNERNKVIETINLMDSGLTDEEIASSTPMTLSEVQSITINLHD